MSKFLDENGDITLAGVKRIIAWGIFAVFFIIFAFGSWAIVPPGHRGVLIKLGAVQDRSLEEGFYWKMPFIHQIRKMNIQTQKEETQADAASKDLQQVTATIATNFHVRPDMAHKVYQMIGTDYKARVIDPAVEEAVKASTSKFNAGELITKREEVKSVAKDVLRAQLAQFNIVLDEFSIVDFQFSEQFDSAIEAKVTAAEQAKKAENDLRRVEFEQQQEIEKAKAFAKKSELEAQALSNTVSASNLIRKIEAEAVLEFAKSWNGILPNNWVIGGTVLDRLIEKFSR